MTDGPVRQASLREHNLGLVLRQVASRAPGPGRRLAGDGRAPEKEAARPPSRADIAAATSLTRATVSALVDDLISGGLLTEVEPAPRAGAGRPAAGLVLSTSGPAGLGLEINVDYLSACVVDLAGTVRHRDVRHADQRPGRPDQVLAEVAGLAADARAHAEREGLVLAGAALAVPGLVTPAGVVRLAPNLGWRDVDVPAGLAAGLARSGPRSEASAVGRAAGLARSDPRSEATRPDRAGHLRHPASEASAASRAALDGLPVTVDNEANLAALGELHAGPAGPASFLYVSGEIGIGAGIVLHGALFRGARGWSGELGHMAVRPDGPACRCGARGCLEQYAGQEAILRAAGADDLLPQAEAGNPAVLDALASAGEALGVAVAGVVNLLDVEAVVLGGIYAPLAAWLRPAVEAEIHRRVLTAAWSPVAVRPSVLGADAAVVGAAGSVVRTIQNHPARWLTRTVS
ncbi:ROK family protein [Phytohabitans sp. ZYX-F-186]|uniref:ROK family protein n=1 Tax=Phytohabitans maris TaxID=3071409 RepID=A0ABU0ZPJ7_9ACTN|nr:ROK family protein [Phytohabitans sp. ZYX-F-186]MDQ7907852.1 ROK family protein [Phytohabitans sp. ZYX-F-186]